MKSAFLYSLVPFLYFFLTVFCVIFPAFFYPLAAQSLFEIKGTVADSINSQAVEYATVLLRNDRDEPVKTALSTETGTFVLKGVGPGNYTLSIVAMGYQRKMMSLELSANQNLHTIYLNPQSTTLNTVVVTADKPLVKMEVDKMVYDLQADPESKINSVLDMMRKVPLITLDHEDNIQMKGSSSYRILINGKPSAMLEKDAKDILRTMPASTIQSIEVITNPPAKYDAEGLTGIINIVTVKKIANGYNGTINFNQRFPSGGPNLGSSFNFKQGKWGASANVNGMLFYDPLRTNRNYRTISGANASELRQDGGSSYKSRNANSRFQLSYELDSLNLVTGQFAYSLGAYDAWGSFDSRFHDHLGFVESYRLGSESQGSRNSNEASFNYQLGFKKSKEQLLTLSYRFTRYFNDSENDVQFQDRSNYTLPNYLQFDEGSTAEHTVQLDYVQAFHKLSMETGVKGIFRTGTTNFLYRALNSSGEYLPVPSFSNQFDNLQNVLAFYNSWQLKLDKWGVKAGIRLEETQLNADFRSSGNSIDRDYYNLLPSFSATRTLKDKSSLGFGYSQRIQRPGIWDMNPFVDRSNPNLERSGNPELRPVVANNFQITYTRSQKTSLTIGLSHGFTNNAIQYIILYDSANKANRLTMSNNGINRSTGMNLSLGHPITSKWNMNFSTNLNYVYVKGYVDGEIAENDGFKGNFALSTGYRFDKGWRLNANMNYLLTPEILLQGEGIAIFFSGLSVNKDLFKEKLSLSAAVNNPFNKFMFFPNNIRGENYTILNGGRGYFRAFSYSLNYRFGKLKGQIAKNKREINNDDSL